MTSPRKLTPQEEARLAQVRQNFQERRRVTESLEGIGTRIGVYSGKGGVGKTTVATNLAVILAAQENDVALFDCDIDCPNVTRVLRITEGPVQNGKKLIPPSRFGVKVMSMSFFQENEDEAIVWRGPMIHNAINQFLTMTEWGELDYLFVDLPPGTGDIQLTLTQAVPLSGAIIVTTPQDVAHTIAEKGLRMFQQVKVPILGIVENMAYYHCPECGHNDPIFREGGGTAASQKLDIPLLARIPLNSSIAAAMDAGEPIAEGEIGDAFAALAGEVMARSSATALGEALNPAAPQELAVVAGGAVQVKWRDGVEQIIQAHTLRSECPCAGCVDEFSGEKLLQPEQIPTDIVVASTASIGRYAVRFDFSDGHNTGIYEFARLRAIGDAAGDAAAFEV